MQQLIQFVPFLVILGAAYFLIFRPQQEEQKKMEKLLSLLKKGDEIILKGGIFGTIRTVTDKEVRVEIADGVIVRALRSSVLGLAGAASEAEKQSVSASE